MTVHLRIQEREETTVEMILLPKVGEHVDYCGIRYTVVAVTHSIEMSKITLELKPLNQSDAALQRLKLNEQMRYRTSEIRAFSPPSPPRMIR